MAGSKRGRFDETNGKVDLDPDLICAVCTELIVDARQVECCGHIYCKNCIEDWITRKRTGTCPNCRSALTVGKLIVDKRSERQSAGHLRNCKFFESFGCPFIGDRAATIEHQQCCSFDPNACKNPYCRTLHVLEMDRQRKKNVDESINHTKALLANIWKTPEDALKNLYNLHMVTIFPIRGTNCDGTYTHYFNWAPDAYDCVVDCAHHNVSIMCSARAATVAYDRTVRFVLIHPTDPCLNHAIDISIPRNQSSIKRGNPNWITEEKFKTFVLNGKFAFGLRAISYVPLPAV